MDTTQRQSEALTTFLASFNRKTLVDLGPALTCSEADAMCEPFRAWDMDDHADRLATSHQRGEEPGDRHYEES